MMLYEYPSLVEKVVYLFSFQALSEALLSKASAVLMNSKSCIFPKGKKMRVIHINTSMHACRVIYIFEQACNVLSIGKKKSIKSNASMHVQFILLFF